MPRNFFSVLATSFLDTFMTRIFSVSSVSVLLTRWCRPRQADSSRWKSSWCRMRLICSVSLRSIAATMPSIVRMTSFETSAVCASACCASVCTAASTALRALSLLGLNSRFSREANSLAGASSVPASAVLVVWVADIAQLSVEALDASAGLPVAASVCSRAGSSSTRLSRSSAPVLPSM